MNFKKLYIFSLALAIAGISFSGLTTKTYAHSQGDCANQVVQSCNAQWPNNYEARIACVSSGLAACNGHSHGSGNGHSNTGPNNYSSGGSNDNRGTIGKKKTRSMKRN